MVSPEFPEFRFRNSRNSQAELRHNEEVEPILQTTRNIKEYSEYGHESEDYWSHFKSDIQHPWCDFPSLNPPAYEQAADEALINAQYIVKSTNGSVCRK